MKTFNLTIGRAQIPVYVDTLTTAMAMRISREGCDGSFHETTLDYHHGVWLTAINTYGTTIEEMLYTYFKYSGIRLYKINYIYLCDDSSVFYTKSDPVNGIISYNEDSVKDIDINSINW